MIHIHRYSPCVAAVTTLGISGVPFPLLFRDSNLKSCNKLYLDFRCSDVDDWFLLSAYALSHLFYVKYVVIIFYPMHCETFYTFLD